MGFLFKFLMALVGLVVFGIAYLIWGFWPTVITVGVAWAGFALLTTYPLGIIGVLVGGLTILIHNSHPRLVGGGEMVIGILIGAGFIWLQTKISGSGSGKKH